MRRFLRDERGFIDLSGIEYFLFAGFGAIIGLTVCAVILFPLSFIWPAAWSAAIWVLGGFTAAGLLWAAVMPK